MNQNHILVLLELDTREEFIKLSEILLKKHLIYKASSHEVIKYMWKSERMIQQKEEQILLATNYKNYSKIDMILKENWPDRNIYLEMIPLQNPNKLKLFSENTKI